jgi:hypothetical protein
MKKVEKNNEGPKIDYLSTSTSLTSKSIDFSKIDKQKLDEYIELMKEHQMNCVKVGNFIEAELAKQRVTQLKKIQEKKNYNEAKKKQTEDILKFKKQREKELSEYNIQFEDKYAEEITKLNELLNELKKRHESELNEYFTNFEKNYPKEMKPSNELVEKQKQLEYYIKIEE